MVKFFLLSFLIVSTFSFRLQNTRESLQIQTNTQLPLKHYSQNILKTCTSDQISMVYNAIAECQTEVLIKTVACLAVYIVKQNVTQWDVFIKNSNSTDSVVFWPSSCVIELNNYGKFNRQYKLWTAYDDMQQQPVFKMSNALAQYKTQNGARVCTEKELLHIRTALKDCDKPSNSEAALCVVNKLKQSLWNKWNAYYSTQGSQIGYWHSLTGCSVQHYDYGAYKRRVQVWQAQ